MAQKWIYYISVDSLVWSVTVFNQIFNKQTPIFLLCTGNLLNHPSSFALKVNSLWFHRLWSPHIKTFTCSHIRPPAGGKKNKNQQDPDTRTQMHGFKLAWFFFFNHKLSRRQYSLSLEKKKVFHSSLVFTSPCRLSLRSGREIFRGGVLDLSYNVEVKDLIISKESMKDFRHSARVKPFPHTANCYLCKLGKIV